MFEFARTKQPRPSLLRSLRGEPLGDQAGRRPGANLIEKRLAVSFFSSVDPIEGQPLKFGRR